MSLDRVTQAHLPLAQYHAFEANFKPMVRDCSAADRVDATCRKAVKGSVQLSVQLVGIQSLTYVPLHLFPLYQHR